MNFAKNVIIRDAFGIFRSKREVIDIALEGLDATNNGEEDSKDDGECAQQVWLQTTFLTDENDDEDDVEAEADNLFDDLQLANEQHEILTNALFEYEEKVKLRKENGDASNVKGYANGRSSIVAKQ